MLLNISGYFYHIGTMSDVHDYVQDYLRVMARPLVVQKSNHYVWTGVHVSTPVSIWCIFLDLPTRCTGSTGRLYRCNILPGLLEVPV